MTETYTLSVTDRGVLRLSPRLREYHLSQEVGDGECVVQPAGKRVFVWIWSERENIRLDLQTDEFVHDDARSRSIHRWGINLSRYIDSLAVEDGELETEVVRFTGEMPDV